MSRFRYKVPFYELNAPRDEVTARVLIQPILMWTMDNCGEINVDWTYYNGMFRFRFRKTYTYFLLRWSG